MGVANRRVREEGKEHVEGGDDAGKRGGLGTGEGKGMGDKK